MWLELLRGCLPGEDDHLGFLIQENGGVVGLGGTSLELGGQNQASLVVGDVIVTLLNEGVDGYSQVDFLLCYLTIQKFRRVFFFKKNNTIPKRTVGIVASEVSEEVDEHGARRRALSLGDSASSAGPFAGRIQALFVVLFQHLNSI